MLVNNVDNSGLMPPCESGKSFQWLVNEPIAECAKHHGSLVTQQNFSTWRLYFSKLAAKSRNAHLYDAILNSGHLWLSYDNELVKLLSIKVLLYPLSTSVVYFYCQLGGKHAIKSFLY